MKKILLLVPVLLAVIGTGHVVNADDKDPVKKAIEARAAIMKLRAWNAGPLFGMAKGDFEYDAEFATLLADNLKAELAMNNARMWPAGSDSSVYEETEALPEIWFDESEAAEAENAYREAVMSVAEQAGNGRDALRSVIGDLGASCKGCHDDFRAEHSH